MALHERRCLSVDPHLWNLAQSKAGVPSSNNTHLTTLDEGVMYVSSFSGCAIVPATPPPRLQ